MYIYIIYIYIYIYIFATSRNVANLTYFICNVTHNTIFTTTSYLNMLCLTFGM